MTQREGILWISDEVQTGFGRTGEHFWGYEAHGITPDLITFAKGVGNGMSLAGVIGRAEVMDALGTNSISTFGGSPITAAAGVATFDYIIDHDLMANARARGAELREGLDAIARSTPAIGEVRGKGLMQGVELVWPGTVEPAPELATRALEAARREGVLIGKGGLHGNVLRIAPPMTISAEQIEHALEAFRRSFADQAFHVKEQ